MNTRRCVICAKRLAPDSRRQVCSDLCNRARIRRNKDRYQRRLAEGRAPRPQASRLREPIPVAPFLQWCERRAKVLHALYADDHNTGDGLPQLMDEIGWDREAGARRLYRWRNEWGADHMAERAVIEDALWRAGVGFWELYPEVAALDEVAA